jgi:glycosyltransferase involved in cell wall biosynthesis
MRIAVYIDALNADQSTWHGREWFIYETLQHMITTHRECEFTILSDKPFTGSYFQTGNVMTVALAPSGTGILLSPYRRINRKLCALLQEQRIEVLLSMTSFLPLHTDIPSCLVVGDIPPVAEDRRSRYLARHFSRYLAQASSVAVISNYYRQKLISRFHIPDKKISVVYHGVHDNFHPLGWEEREEIKNQYTDGREYFICLSRIHPEKNIINLLKAFSILKKRLHSNMVLVLAGAWEPMYKEFPELLRTYYFRDDVKWLGHVGQPEIAKLVGAAYAMICPSATESFDLSVLEALQCHVPVLAASGTASRETGGDAALYFDPLQADEMGNQLCEIYKNENLRAHLIAAADAQAAKFSWDRTAALLWQSLEQAVEEKK